MNPGFALNNIPLAFLFFVMAIVIMWFSAKVVGVPRAGFFQCLLATLGVSVLMGSTMSALTAFGLAGAVILLLIALTGSIAILRAVFRIPTLPAFLVWLVNIMVQVLLISIMMRMLIGDSPSDLPSPPPLPPDLPN